MVFFYNAFGESEAKAPASFLGCVAGLEDIVEVFACNAFAGVAHIYIYMFAVGAECYVYLALTTHGIYGIFAQVFYNPFYERLASHSSYGVLW